MKRIIQMLAIAVLLRIVPSARAEKAESFVFIPTNKSGPFPVAVWLHGYRGYSTNGYLPGESKAVMQKHADLIGAVIVGFPATTDLGDGTQQWSEEPVADHAYIQSRLKEIGKTVNLDLSKVALFGFSQGAMVAADLATQYPDAYLGAVLMSPGGIGLPKAANIQRSEHTKQVYFCLCGANEQEGNVGLTKFYARHLEKVLGAKVTLKLYAGVSKHARPPDIVEKFPEWISTILRLPSP
jgi:predicted esterase